MTSFTNTCLSACPAHATRVTGRRGRRLSLPTLIHGLRAFVSFLSFACRYLHAHATAMTSTEFLAGGKSGAGPKSTWTSTVATASRRPRTRYFILSVFLTCLFLSYRSCLGTLPSDVAPTYPNVGVDNPVHQPVAGYRIGEDKGDLGRP